MLGIRPGLPLCPQSLQGLLECHLSLCQVGFHHVKFSLDNSRPLDRTQFHRPCSCRLDRPVLGLTAGGLQLVPKLVNLPQRYCFLLHSTVLLPKES